MITYFESISRKTLTLGIPSLKGKSAGIAAILEGLKSSLPICLGYIPIGLAFGVIAQKAGLAPFQIGLMSAIVFAGSSQFIAVSMLSQGASPISIVATTFVVNLRHFLMSSALSVYLGRVRRGVLSLFAYGVTDESFAINLVKFREGNWSIGRALTLNHAANLTWIVSTIVGGIGGEFIPKGAFGTPYALPAMFICLLAFQLKERRYTLTAIISGTFAVLISLLVSGSWYVILASVISATIGVILKKRIQ